MFGLRASAEPQRQQPCGDAAAVACAGRYLAAGELENSWLGRILKSMSNHGAGRWCP